MTISDHGTDGQRRSAFALRRGGPKRGGAKISTSLVALSSSAVLAIYAVGYARTQPAESQITAAADVAAAAPLAPVTSPSSAAPSGRVQSTLPSAGGPSGSTAPSSQGNAAPNQTAPRNSSVQTAGYRDGTYVGTGSGRHGSVEATVVIKSGKIVSADISRCGTRYPCSYINSLPAQVVSRQGPPVNLISGATDSSTAYRQAVSAALARAGAA